MRPSCTCTRGLRPLDPFSGNCLTDRIELVPTVTERRKERGSLAWCRGASGPADESPMTACGGNFIGDEIMRNEQCPHEADLRRLSLRRTPPTRMLCIRGKPGNHPRGKVHFPLRMFPGFLGPEALKLSVTPAHQAELVCLSQLRYFADCGSRVLRTLAQVWGHAALSVPYVGFNSPFAIKILGSVHTTRKELILSRFFVRQGVFPQEYWRYFKDSQNSAFER